MPQLAERPSTPRKWPVSWVFEVYEVSEVSEVSEVPWTS